MNKRIFARLSDALWYSYAVSVTLISILSNGDLIPMWLWHLTVVVPWVYFMYRARQRKPEPYYVGDWFWRLINYG